VLGATPAIPLTMAFAWQARWCEPPAVRPLLARVLWLGGLSPLLVAGCRTSPPSSADPSQASTATTPTSGSASADRSAFVVLTDEATIVIPTDPAVATRTLPGHWVGALPGAAPGAWGRVPVELTTRSEPGQPSLPVCPSLMGEDACELDLDPEASDPLASAEGTIYAKGEVVAGQAPRWRFTSHEGDEACSCVFVRGLSTDGPAIDLDDPAVQEAMANSGYSEEEYLETCSEEPEADLSPTAYVGGVLYLGGLYSNSNCSGYNLYSAAGEALPLRPGATEPKLERPEPTVCELGTPFGDDGLLAGKPRLDCEPNDQREAFALRRGRLVRFIGSTEGAEDSDCSCASSVPLDAASCPSALDPCGQGRDMPGHEAWEQRWVTTDERLALAKLGKDLVVVAAGRDAPIRTLPAPAELLGVEHHPDTALVEVELPPKSLRVAIPPLHETDAKFRGSAKQWGNRCFAHLQAERLDAAEAACYAGLLAKGNDGTRGALTYNLGRIEEARGEQARALAYYQRSQRLRPNKATAERLRALDR
jgi:hypothetical protein